MSCDLNPAAIIGADGEAHPPGGFFGPFAAFRGNRFPRQRPAEVIDQSQLNIRPAQVNADKERRDGVGGGNKSAGQRHKARVYTMRRGPSRRDPVGGGRGDRRSVGDRQPGRSVISARMLVEARQYCLESADAGTRIKDKKRARWAENRRGVAISDPGPTRKRVSRLRWENAWAFGPSC